MEDRRARSRRPRIVVDALNLAHGGGSIVMSRIVDALVDSGAVVTVAVAREGVLDTARKTPDRIALHPEASGVARALSFRVFRMPGILRETGADGLLSFNFFTPVAIPQVTYHINVIPFLPFAERRAAVGAPRALIQARMARQALRKSAANGFESRHLMDLARAEGKARPSDFIAYTGIDIPQQAGARAAPPDQRVICMVTSGARHKNNDTALRAFRAFAENTADARLEVFGKPEAIRASLSPEMVEYCDFSGKVVLRGYVGRDELYATLSGAFALLTASELESFYMVALEAMIVGCPVVAADISSIQESTNETGWLFPVGDWRAAADALMSLRDAEVWARSSSSGHEWARAFDADEMAAKFAARLLEQLDDGRP